MAKKHIHKYYKRTIGSQWVWACGLDDCSHYMPVHMTELLQGKRTLCWNYDKGNVDCEKVTLLDTRNWAKDKPICEACDPSVLEVSSSNEPNAELVEKLKQMGIKME